MCQTRRKAAVLTALALCLCAARGQLVVPNLTPSEYVQLGDLNIGMLASVHGFSADNYCGDEVTEFLEIAEAFVYVLKEVNERDDILANITLGHVILDDCGKDVTALARSLSFLPDGKDVKNSSESTTLSRYDVVGVVGPANSGQAVMMASLLSIFQIPVLGTMAGSNDLSDKSRFEYFLRLVPSNRAMSYALVDIAEKYGWSYVSLVYSEGNLGENGAKDVEYKAAEYGMCIAFSKRIPSRPTDNDYKNILAQLKRYKSAKAVFLILERVHIESFFQHLLEQGMEGQFQWLSNSIIAAVAYSEVSEAVKGAIFPGYDMYSVPGFSTYYRQQKPWNNPNPWLAELWQDSYDCVLDQDENPANKPRCSEFPGSSDSESNTAVSLIYEAVTLYAYALHDIISETCPESFAGSPVPHDCVSKPTLLQKLKNSALKVQGRLVQFDENGNRVGSLIIKQLQPKQFGYGLNFQPVGHYDTAGDNLTLFDSLLNWDALKDNTGNDTLYLPKSVCSEPCAPKTYKVRSEMACCWECVSCREYQIIVVTNGTERCSMCEENKWPDREAVTHCLPISPTYLEPHTWIAIGLLAVVAACFALSTGTTFLFVKYRGQKLIKATSRELSLIILTGASLACLMSLVFILKPSQKTCIVGSIGFHLSVNLLYTPLLLKTCRIYRIFESGRKGKKMRPRCVSSQSLMTFAVGMILFQIVLSMLSQVTAPSKALLRMPVRTEKYVELVCEQELHGFLFPLSYNVAIILVCSVLGFLTRKLPENFNESWYIFVSTSSTCFMWAIFLPTYFTAFYAYHKAALLAFCLVLNALVTLCCLFVPKLYAILYVDDGRIRLGTMNTKLGPAPSSMDSGSRASGSTLAVPGGRFEHQPPSARSGWMSRASSTTVTPLSGVTTGSSLPGVTG